MSDFSKEVINRVKRIPKGKVASYGQIALMSGKPRAAREVGWILHQQSDSETPWWRIINNSGRISIKNSEYSSLEQKALLEADGVIVNEKLEIDMKKYRYKMIEETDYIS